MAEEICEEFVRVLADRLARITGNRERVQIHDGSQTIVLPPQGHVLANGLISAENMPRMRESMRGGTSEA